MRPLRARTRERDELPRPAADYEAQQGVESFARWARKTLAPALRAVEIGTWDDVHQTCGRFGVKLQLHGNGLVFEDIEQGIPVKASSVDRGLSKPRLCKRLGDFQRASLNHLEATRHTAHRYSPMPARVPQTLWTDYMQLLEQGRHDRERAWGDYRETASRDHRGLKEKYRQQRTILAALPVSALDKKRLTKQLALRQGIDVRNLRRRLAAQRKAIQKTPHPGTWRHFVASRVADRDAGAIRLLQRRERQRGSHDLERG
jgi:hypothetical protein